MHGQELRDYIITWILIIVGLVSMLRGSFILFTSNNFRKAVRFLVTGIMLNLIAIAISTVYLVGGY